MSSTELAAAIRDKAGEVARQQRNVKRGRIASLEPLTVDLLDEDRVLDEDDLDLSSWVRFYDQQVGLRKNNTVVLMREGGDWTVIDVISKRNVEVSDAETKKKVTEHIADDVLDGGPHGFPALGSDGMTWVRQGGALVAVDVATQAELNTLSSDPRFPTQGENDALAGTRGTPSDTNRYETAQGRDRSHMARRAESPLLTGGGTISTDASLAIAWSQRFIAISGGKGPDYTTDGYFDIMMPPDGTVISGLAGTPSITVAGGRIPIPTWTALYYILPVGSNHTTQNGNFRAVHYASMGTADVPWDWCLVAVRSQDISMVKFATGHMLRASESVEGWRHVPDGSVTDTKVAAANKDGAVGTPSMRTLGLGPGAAMPGARDQLLTNGYGQTGNNQNFSSFTFDPVDKHGGFGSFKQAGGTSVNRQSDELIPVDVEKHYYLAGYGKSGDIGGGNFDAANRQYFGLVPYDADGNIVFHHHALRMAGSALTTLAADLNPGATTVTLTDATGWYSGTSATQRKFAWWPYTDGRGYTWPAYTYSRNLSADGTWAQGGISGNVITLAAPWAGPALPAGTPVRNANGNTSTYKYVAASNAVVPNTWTKYEGWIGGLDTLGDNVADQFYHGTAYVKLLWLVNNGTSSANHIRWSDLQFAEVARLDRDLSIPRQLVIPTPGSVGGILLGGDVNLYRETTNILRTDDDFTMKSRLRFSDAVANGGSQALIALDPGGATKQIGFFDYGTSATMLTVDPTDGGRIGIGGSGSVVPGARLALPAGTTPAGGIVFGTDVHLYRLAASALKLDENLRIGATGPTAEAFRSERGYVIANQATAADIAFGTNIALGATPYPFVIYPDGKHEWGVSGSPRDVNLYRRNVNELATDDMFAVIRAAAGDFAFATHVSGDANRRFYVQADGEHNWGDGTAVTDLSLWRQAPGVLRTDGSLRLGGDLRINDATIRRYSSAYSFTRAAGDIVKMGEFTHTGPSQNVCVTGTVRITNGPAGGLVRFVVWVRSNALPDVQLTFYQEPLAGQNFKPRIRVWKDGVVNPRWVIGYDWPTGSPLNHGWDIEVMERGDYGQWINEQGAVLVDTTGLTEVTGTGSTRTHEYPSGTLLGSNTIPFWDGTGWAAATPAQIAGELGLAGSVVGTSDAQLLTGKTFNDPAAEQEAVTRKYLNEHRFAYERVRVATTANITLSGTQTIDGIAVVAGDRVLVKNQTTASQNGIYVVAAGAWTRAIDADTSAKVTSGMLIPVDRGTAQADQIWRLTTNSPITLGTTSLTFAQVYPDPGKAAVSHTHVLNDLTNLTPFGQNLLVQSDAFAAADALAVPFVTSLPSFPSDGYECFFIADATNGVGWHLKYHAAGGTYKWLYLGGAPLYAEVPNSETHTTSTYSALATAGPSITLPLNGDYDVEIGFEGMASIQTTSTYMSYDIGGTAAVDADGARHRTGSNDTASTAQVSRMRRKTGLSLGAALVSKYRGGAGATNTFANRWMRVTPVRVG